MWRLGLILCCALVVSGMAWTQDAGAPPAAAAPETDEKLSLSLPADNNNDIAKGISLNLVDLAALERALQARSEGQTVRMSLDQAVKTALVNNEDILVAAWGPEKSKGDVMSAAGEFDPVLQGQTNYRFSSMSVSQEIYAYAGIPAIRAYQTSVQGGLAGKLHTGTQYQLAFDSTKEESTYGKFIESFHGTLMLTLTQPLLRGFGIGVNEVRLKAARANLALSQAQLELAVLQAVSDTVKAYWDLVGAVEALKVRREALDNANRLFEMNDKRRGIGTAADLDVLQAKAAVAMRQNEMVAALSQVENASDLLKACLGMKNEGVFSHEQIAPTDRPNVGALEPLDAAVSEKSLRDSVTLALERRPEMRMADLQIESAELEEKRTRNEMQPQFDVTSSYSQGGRDHKLREMIYGIRNGDEYTFSYGVQGSMPIGNRAARGAYQRARSTRREIEQRKSQAAQTVSMNVHMAHRAVETNQILVESSRQARKLQEANVAAEERRLQLGVTTSFQVLKVQEDLTSARTQEVQSEVAVEKARVDLLAAEGRLLDTLGVEFAAPDSEDPPGFLKSVMPRWE